MYICTWHIILKSSFSSLSQTVLLNQYWFRALNTLSDWMLKVAAQALSNLSVKTHISDDVMDGTLHILWNLHGQNIKYDRTGGTDRKTD